LNLEGLGDPVAEKGHDGVLGDDPDGHLLLPDEDLSELLDPEVIPIPNIMTPRRSEMLG